jgi:hypothetical protein
MCDNFDIENIIYFFTKYAMSSTVLSLPVQLVFPGLSLFSLSNIRQGWNFFGQSVQLISAAMTPKL